MAKLSVSSIVMHWESTALSSSASLTCPIKPECEKCFELMLMLTYNGGPARSRCLQLAASRHAFFKTQTLIGTIRPHCSATGTKVLGGIESDPEGCHRSRPSKPSTPLVSTATIGW